MSYTPKGQQPPVTYIRIEKYLHPFVTYKYGSIPVDLPVCCKLYDIFSMGLVPNYGVRSICYSTCSAQVFKNFVADPNAEEADRMVSPTVREKFMPFIMPERVVSGGTAKKTNEWYQLTRISYRMFIAQLKNEFWSMFIDFDSRFRITCTRTGGKYTRRYAFEQFLIKVGIDTVYLDTIYRDWRRKKREIERFARFAETLD